MSETLCDHDLEVARKGMAAGGITFAERVFAKEACEELQRWRALVAWLAEQTFPEIERHPIDSDGACWHWYVSCLGDPKGVAADLATDTETAHADNFLEAIEALRAKVEVKL